MGKSPHFEYITYGGYSSLIGVASVFALDVDNDAKKDVLLPMCTRKKVIDNR